MLQRRKAKKIETDLALEAAMRIAPWACSMLMAADIPQRLALNRLAYAFSVLEERAKDEKSYEASSFAAESLRALETFPVDARTMLKEELLAE